MNITQIILAIIALISAILTGFVIPWLKSKIGINNDKISENQRYFLELAIETAVKAAEQLYNSDEGQKKKAYAIGILESQGYKVDTPAIDAAVEQMVFDVHQAMKKDE